MDRWMDGRVEGWMERWIDMEMDEWMGRSMEGWMDRWNDGRMDGRTDGWAIDLISSGFDHCMPTTDGKRSKS